MKCFYCKEDIIWDKKEPVKEARYRMVAIDRPYLNLFFHLECFRKVSDDLLLYLTRELNYGV